MKRPSAVAILGCGTVGGATAALLLDQRSLLAAKTGLDIELRYIVDKDFSHAESLNLDPGLFEADLDKVLADPDVVAVVELIGGTGIARSLTEKILKAGKRVVTANKALIARHGAELMAIAREAGVSISFEASCGGGIPILRALYDGILPNRIDAFYGIVNGTCNYILTEMMQKGNSFTEALKEAQAGGLAEADPTLDVSGGDSAHKLAIMSSLAFGQRVNLESIPVQGIDDLRLIDLNFGRELGYVIKLLAIAQSEENGVSLRVRPAFISTEHPLAWVSGPFNAVSVYGHAVGHTMYYGRGAGGSPTASAVTADIISSCMGTADKIFSTLKIWPDQTKEAVLLSPEEIQGRYYVRLMVEDKPGVFAQIAGVLGENRISLSSVLQKEPYNDKANSVPVVITTHRVQEGNMRNALAALDTLPVVREPSICIEILDEHEEIFA
ncbi:homoserine dehydrogenase [Marispirochaeta sp.]|uniref:homoserine dehydrogenase n=1 Tax=Marispirochaeta sp. TaxID=2038653 RepID=UPI0029C68DE3|nr:homoserine dehydrogenase [Marispirochaeta sp.]